MLIPDRKVLHVGQGEYRISSCPETMMSTVLGSCVSACIWDPAAGIGGMNHILLPDGTSSDLQCTSLGTNMMELLINGLLREGADRQRFRAKLFGGAQMFAGLGSIGTRNAEFIADFCRHEGIDCDGHSLGGQQGRRIQFWPVGGRARQQLLARDAVEEALDARNPVSASGSDLELF
ncbi:chemotaxis protein CheD [Aliiruegeria haliotis]|uniref:Probable chemoreceptor glutamine deamidase CheD n=1 Tax=Aliiruegeria haliotis TaxID=1280846 RepID=A0A2T0RJY3_9RHOB|nr:chemotaxis protein CheD [Aliiruegeria haliotis]PRY21427.1 chemotaxis protein CheD [Aliiruegeria haliotis]